MLLAVLCGGCVHYGAPRYDNPCDPQSVHYIRPTVIPAEGFYIYHDAGSALNHCYLRDAFSRRGASDSIDVDMDYHGMPEGGASCIRIRYVPPTSGGGAQMHYAFMTDPLGNWGDRGDQGYNLCDARYIEFYARSDDSAHVQFGVGGLGAPSAGRHKFPDTVMPLVNVPLDVEVDLGTDWQRYTLEFAAMRGRHPSATLCRVIGPLNIIVGQAKNNGPVTFYVDEIRYVP